MGWLREHEGALRCEIGDHVAHPRRTLLCHELQRVVAPATDIRPLEKLLVPAELDGRTGVYRRPQAHCLLAATNDYQALLAWLRAKQGLTPEQRAAAKAKRRVRDTGIEGPLDWLQHLSHTQRAYRKEAERFLLWAVVERHKPLSSMTTEDCIAYREFIADPRQRGRWCGPRGRERWSPLWRPFEKPLDPVSQGFAITALKNLYAFWVDKNYVMGNPWSGGTVPRSAQPSLNTARSFTFDQWAFVLEQAEQQPQTTTGHRLRFVVPFLYATGLRLSEAVAARLDDLRWVEYPPDAEDPEPVEGWLLNVVGKGGRLREVPVPIDVVSQLGSYLASRGLDPDPQNLGNAGVFLLGRATDMADLAPRVAGWGGRRSLGRHRLQYAVRPAQGVLPGMRAGAARTRRCEGGRAAGARQHPLVASYPCITLDRTRHPR